MHAYFPSSPLSFNILIHDPICILLFPLLLHRLINSYQHTIQIHTTHHPYTHRENFAYGYGGKFGVQTDRRDRSAFGADERMSCIYPSFASSLSALAHLLLFYLRTLALSQRRKSLSIRLRKTSRRGLVVSTARPRPLIA